MDADKTPTPPALAAAQMADWQAIRYGDTDATRAALAYWRERGWKVDDPTFFPGSDEIETRIHAFKSGYTTAQARIEALEGERDANRAQAIHLTAKLSEERRFKREFEEACRAEVAAVDAAMVSLRDELAAKTEFVMQAEAALTAARTRAEGLEALVVDIYLNVKHLPDWAEQRITEVLTPAKEEADNTAALRRENVTLRAALTFARQHIHDGEALHSCGMDAEDGSYNDGCGPDACWACLTNTALARIDRALTPPPATTGEEPTR